MRACWLKWVGRDWSISADYIWLNYSDANNWLAGSAFAVYLISDNSLAQSWLWKRLFTFTNLGNQLGILLVMVIPSLVMACCLTVDIGRRTINSHLSLTKKSFV